MNLNGDIHMKGFFGAFLGWKGATQQYSMRKEKVQNLTFFRFVSCDPLQAVPQNHQVVSGFLDMGPPISFW